MKYVIDKIRFATLNDKKNIIKFVNQNWKRAQILNYDILFNNYFLDKDNKINFVLAEDSEKNIYGVLGFIKANNSDKPDIWMSNLLTIPSNEPFLGIKLERYIYDNLSCNVIAAVNILEDLKIVRKRIFKAKVDVMKQYYMLQDKENYLVAKIVDKKILAPQRVNSDIRLIDNIDDLDSKFVFPKNRVPNKDFWYIKKRYHNNLFNYLIYGLVENNKIIAILVAREVYVEKLGVKIFRIVDYLGDDDKFVAFGFFLKQLIDKNDYEYIDLFCYGISSEILSNAGFIEVLEKDNNIIPDYFEPFECKSSTIYFSTSDINNFHAFRADADQDRPNLDYRREING